MKSSYDASQLSDVMVVQLTRQRILPARFRGTTTRDLLRWKKSVLETGALLGRIPSQIAPSCWLVSSHIHSHVWRLSDVLIGLFETSSLRLCVTPDLFCTSGPLILEALMTQGCVRPYPVVSSHVYVTYKPNLGPSPPSLSS